MTPGFREPNPDAGPSQDAVKPAPGRRVLVIDDDLAIGLSCKRCLEPAGHAVEVTTEPLVGLGMALAGRFDVVLVDLSLPGVDGLSIVQRIARSGAACEVVVITGFATVKTAVAALKGGAADYLSKPFTPYELRAAVERAAGRSSLIRENQRLRLEIERLRGVLSPAGEMPGTWAEFKTLARQLRRAAVQMFQREFLAAALERNGGNVSRTARALGLQRTNLHAMLRRHGIRGGQAGGSSAAL